MPIREYQCEDCGAAHEKLIRGDEQEVTCPACGSRRQKRVISRVAPAPSQSGSAHTCTPKG
jgi:putative FmdB family regulatory protein